MYEWAAVHARDAATVRIHNKSNLQVASLRPAFSLMHWKCGKYVTIIRNKILWNRRDDNESPALITARNNMKLAELAWTEIASSMANKNEPNPFNIRSWKKTANNDHDLDGKIDYLPAHSHRIGLSRSTIKPNFIRAWIHSLHFGENFYQVNCKHDISIVSGAIQTNIEITKADSSTTLRTPLSHTHHMHVSLPRSRYCRIRARIHFYLWWNTLRHTRCI